METLKIFKIPLCVGPLLCGDFENFSKLPCVWALCCVETLKIFQSSPVCGPCAGDFEIFSKKIPVLGNFLKASVEISLKALTKSL